MQQTAFATVLGILNAQYGHTQFHPFKGVQNFACKCIYGFPESLVFAIIAIEKYFCIRGCRKS